MTAKKGKDATQHDDVSGLFARLGTPAGQGYHDFAYTQLPPRTSSLPQADAPAAVEPFAVAPDPVQPPVGVAAPTPSLSMPAAVPVPERALQPVVTAADQVPDALAPLRKLRQLDEPAPRGVQPADRPAQTPLERLFQRLLQADARSCAQSPLKRLRSR
ncbi:hypothetical protein [Xanthomonas phaseoli]|uniref:Uncharacterized protein n=1 Tax=Xanthomonas phaseoli pv. dieffenbachiae TaxID=92828 RepID=A0A1V9H9M0_9XANT|nr:hypothetical protein [Xanthomonas phaseoli]MBO9788972.1 hypothetical protein [Xanthomonas phaseoli pv. dieffenbachiae]MBO9830685.1 hypothetical protein [Xanthomonas phaseoli pv. dieffenbachiae]MBO9835466.1 hypothetical protein [Xanthomonas phaseoli pv. dieffenbachiae]MBO9840347.1 hypothetical protein [Xanthomonas phaseoli pv. dieffenbachiae]MBO9853678.1 hypothetical protein [Xanthomonas phaseoli pv. dieffenbachiae]